MPLIADNAYLFHCDEPLANGFFQKRQQAIDILFTINDLDYKRQVCRQPQICYLSQVGKIQSYPTKKPNNLNGDNEAFPVTWIVGQDFNAITGDGNRI